MAVSPLSEDEQTLIEVLREIALEKVAHAQQRLTKPRNSPGNGMATRDDIDTAMKLGCGYLMGPFTLLDYVGLDTTSGLPRRWRSTMSMYKESLYAPPPLLRRMVYSGMLGRKSGGGFYTF